MTSSRAARKVLSRISSVLMMAGALCVGIWGWSEIHRALYQSRENRLFDENVQAEAAAPATVLTPARASAPANGSVIGRLVIQRLHLRAMVREGTDDSTLDLALGHIPGTALPGRDGNVAIAGHRDTLFRCLRDIARGDTVVLETARGKYTYRVDRIGVVQPRDVSVLNAGQYPALTMVTCYPFRYVGPAPERMIVKARLLSGPS